MKAFLMYPDRDFNLEQPLPANEAALTADLELNTLFDAMARNDDFLFKVVRQAVLSSLTDPATIRYRQDILKDCLKNAQVVRALYSIPIETIQKKQKGWLSIFSHHPSGVLSSAISLMELFVEMLTKLRQIADEHAPEFESEGFMRFFTMIRDELNDQFFEDVRIHLRNLHFPDGVLLSAELGRGNEGRNYILRLPPPKKGGWLKRMFEPTAPSYSFSIHPRDEAGGRALSDIQDQGVNLVANALAQSTDHIDSFLSMLRNELGFYMGCLNLHERLEQLQEPVFFPAPCPAGERRHSFHGLYDVCLALTKKQAVIGNDLQADGKDLVMITGANQGGKSTFLRSIGLAQLMLQAGMFVPAESGFEANVCTRLFTHYKREEDTSMKSGKFDEELKRMSEIVDQLEPDSLVLFNESFAATNEREGSEIARQIVSALLEKRVKVFFVTHLYDFAHSLYGRDMKNAFFLRAQRQSGGVRTFKVVRGEPLQTSHGTDLYRKVFESDGKGLPE